MPLPGGASDKLGNRYEGRWIVSCMLDVMSEKADSIRIEKPGEDAFEFLVRMGKYIEGHQVKRQNTKGHWTLKSLGKVLSSFFEKLNESTMTCVFISIQAADQLDELANRAKNAENWSEFNAVFLRSEQQLNNFGELCEIWNCSSDKAFSFLRRIRVETVSENFLIKVLEDRISALVDSDSTRVRVELAEYALNNIHDELSTYDIWSYLRERGYRRREWSKDLHVLASVEKANQRYLSAQKDVCIAGEIIPRDEVQVVFEEIVENKNSVLLIGEAGVGKTSVLLQTIQKIIDSGIPTLAFRVDNLNPEVLPDNLGKQLGLPASPATVLENIAQGRECILVIDQLDAVSMTSGRNPDFFECLKEIIRQVEESYPNIRVLIGCRKFDFENDSRLKKLGGEKGLAKVATVKRLSPQIVKRILPEIGFDVEHLSNQQLNLFSIPLHLWLLAEVVGNIKSPNLRFETAKDLFDSYWDYKPRVIKKKIERSIQWKKVIETLCNYMSSRPSQELSVPEALIDEYKDDVEAMASEYVLVRENKRIRFFHESFFDYAFARRFSLSSQGLVEFLNRDEQHLFRRAQVRQILLYERDSDEEKYCNDLREILTSSNVRFHIKEVVISLLSTLSEPKIEELEIVLDLVLGLSNPLGEKVWRLFRNSVGFFHLLDTQGRIEAWLLGGNENYVERALSILSALQKNIPHRVVELITPLVGRSEEWNNRLKNFIDFSNLDKHRELFELYLKFISEDIFTHQESGDDRENFWFQIYRLKDKKPEWACEAIGIYLNRWLDSHVTNKHAALLNRYEEIFATSTFDSTLEESAQASPIEFIRYVLPVVFRILELAAVRKGEPPWIDSIWYDKPYGNIYEFNDRLLNCVESSLRSMAVNQPENFAIVAEQKLENSCFETAHYLLVRAYEANGKRFANEAIDYLLDNLARLKIGYLAGSGNIHAASYWATRELLAAATPWCSSEQLFDLENILLHYFPAHQRNRKNLRFVLTFHGYPQFLLLDAISIERRSNAVNQRIREWQRKFIIVEKMYPRINLVDQLGNIKLPQPINAYSVDSPIPHDVGHHITDSQWLKAIEVYSSNAWHQRQNRLIGGDSQLSGIVLRTQAKQYPNRFANLVLKFPNYGHESYFENALYGIGETSEEVDVDIVSRVIQKCYDTHYISCGKAIGWLVQKKPQLSWPENIYVILLDYALNASDSEHIGNTNCTTAYEILSQGINTIRGSALSAISNLILANNTRANFFLPYLQQFTQEQSIAVKACTVWVLLAFLNYDHDLAVQLFIQFCLSEHLLLGTQSAERFLHYALPTHFEILRPTLEQMLNSNSSEVAKVGARKACIASLVIDEADYLAERCLSARQSHRLAAAQVFSVNLKQASYRERCANALVRLFHDRDEKVRSQAASCFSKLEGNELCAYSTLTNQFIHSLAFTDCFHDLVWALEKTTANLPELTFSVCSHYIDDFFEEYARSGKAYKVDIDSIIQLLIKTYSQSAKNLDLQSNCLDLIDRMSEIEVYGLKKVLENFER